MKIEIFTDADSVVGEAAKLIAGDARAAVAARGSFVMAVSGGHTPWLMLRARACLSTLPCAPSRFIPCRWNRPTWRRHASNTRRLYRRSPARPRCLILFTWDSDRTGTLLRWCLGTRSSTSMMRMSQSADSTREDGG